MSKITDYFIFLLVRYAFKSAAKQAIKKHLDDAKREAQADAELIRLEW